MTAEAPTVDADQVVALEEEREFLLASLRDLEREKEAADIDDGDYQTLRDDYTARAAAVLRTLEEIHAADDATEAESPDSGGTIVSEGSATTGVERGVRDGRARRPGGTRRTAVIAVTIVLVVAVGAGLGVAAFSGERLGNENVSGRGMSETARHTTQAQQLETEGKAAEALKEYDAAITADPGNIVALTYKGWLLGRAGFADRAMASIDQAIAVNPNYPDAHFFKGMILYESLQNPAGAVQEFEKYLASNPPPSAAAAVQGVLDRARGDAAAALPPAPSPDAPAEGSAPPDVSATTVPG